MTDVGHQSPSFFFPKQKNPNTTGNVYKNVHEQHDITGGYGLMAAKNCNVCGRPEDRMSCECPRSDVHFICMVKPADGFAELKKECV